MLLLRLLPILLTLITAAHASDAPAGQCQAQRSFSVDGQTVSLCWVKTRDSWVSPDCLRDGKTVCGALKLAADAKPGKVVLNPDDLRGGKNPGSVLCAKLGGQVELAKTPRGSEATLCKAKDGSRIDCNSLQASYR